MEAKGILVAAGKETLLPRLEGMIGEHKPD
jgi:hypothetical protein